MLHVGDSITVRVLKFDKDKERISLGLKQLQADPWESVIERYPVWACASSGAWSVSPITAPSWNWKPALKA